MALLALTFDLRAGSAAPAAAEPVTPPIPMRPVSTTTAPDRAVRLDGTVGANLYGSARDAGASPAAVAAYIHAIAAHVDVAGIRPEDRFDMVVAPGRASDGEATGGQLLYAALTQRGRTTRLMRWTTDEGAMWFDAAGVGPQSEGFVMPVTGARLSSGFGARFHPILGFTRMHQGVDLAAPLGTPIVAAADGIVRFAGPRGGYGNFVQIAHDGGLGTGYGHMSAIAVRPGEPVTAGTVIGYVGSSGLSTGPHCHFEVYVGGTPVDPMSVSFVTARRLGGAALAQFRAQMARWQALPLSRNG